LFRSAKKGYEMIDETTAIHSRELAALLGCEERSLRNYRARGLLVPAGRGRYRLVASLQALYRHLSASAAGRALSQRKLDADNELSLLRQSQRKLNEQKLAEAEGRLIPVAAIAPAWDRIIVATRQRMLAVPGQCRFALPHFTASDQATIDDIVREGLTELSENPPPPDTTRSSKVTPIGFLSAVWPRLKLNCAASATT
jgi:phage terminase Nu1 subunit (DNA packaging protein)